MITIREADAELLLRDMRGLSIVGARRFETVLAADVRVVRSPPGLTKAARNGNWSGPGIVIESSAIAALSPAKLGTRAMASGNAVCLGIPISYDRRDRPASGSSFGLILGRADHRIARRHFD